MSDKASKTVTWLLGSAVAISTLLGSFVVLPQRMQAAEEQIRLLQAQQRNDRELLTRIEERLIAVQNELRKRL